MKENGYDVKVGEYICEPGAKSLGWFVKPATMYAISNNTEHPEAAAKLLNYLLNGEEMNLKYDKLSRDETIDKIYSDMYKK